MGSSLPAPPGKARDTWGLDKMQTLILHLWGGTSRLPGDPADALGCLSVMGKGGTFFCDGVVSKGKTACMSIREVLA